MVKRPFAVAMMLLATATFTYAAAPEIQSGLQPGERVPAYHVNDCTGPSAGKSLCYRCKFGNRPVVNIFTRDMTPEVVKLISQIDKKVEANQSQQMSAFVVHLTNDTDASSTALKKAAKENRLKTPLTNYDGEAGPASYKIAQNADVTVMMWVDGQVKVNHAFTFDQLNGKAIKQVVGDTSKILN